ncbi:MAG TPA: hypothetical protein PKC67_15590 [Kiritimatiellia bacterium]|nr:hypothetical protein [Kiritimatiellia bacterium]HMP35758.1 hypothetical protein [Kiritimatiellia bacterium]
MSVHRTIERRTREQGIALVIVLGFLAIMTIMAVSFTINMRTERLTSRLYLDTVRSRHFIDTALARALSDLDYAMNNASPALAAPNFDFYASSGGTSSNVTLFTGIVSNYLPSGWVGNIPQARLVNIPDPFTAANPPVGQYAYLAVNLTGFLDMNHAGLGTSRDKGRSPAEIRIKPALLSDIDTDSSWESFANNLDTRWRRIETIAEYLAVCGGTIIKSNLGSRSFFPASRSLVEMRPLVGTNTSAKVAIGGNKAALQATVTNILDGFVSSGLTAAQAQDAYNQLLDFVDDDLIPENAAGLAAEPVPMINEIVASGTLERNLIDSNNSTYEFTLRDFKVTVELWYPFPFDANNPVDFRIDPNSVFSFQTTRPGLPPPLNVLFEQLNPTNGQSATIDPPTITINQRGYRKVEFRYGNKTATATGAGFGGPAAGLSMNIIVRDLAVLFDNQRVDVVANPELIQLQIPPGASRQAAIACLDPRLNHRTGAPFWKTENNPSLEAINANTAAYNAGEAIGPDPVMYSRNFPLGLDKAGVGLGSVADLGYLSLGDPWRTIALYDRPGVFTLNPVLDYFSVNNPTGSIHGLVNINSRRRDILASVFLEQPIDAAPEREPTLGRLDVNTARTFADAIIARTSTTPFDRLSQIGSLPTIYSSSFNNNLTSDARIESLIRNSINLFTTRQNLFGIILQANTLSPDGAVTSVDRALAVVWRDPVAMNGVNNTIVRYFAWLTEE